MAGFVTLGNDAVEEIVRYMLQAIGKGPNFKTRLPSMDQLKAICKESGEIFMSQEVLLELEAPMTIVGDVHGQYHDLLRIFDYGGFPPQTNYLFLGDYVDRGKQSLEVIILLLCYKILYPENFFMLRGNHECAAITRIYGFYDECKRKFNVKTWKQFTEVFNRLPFVAIIDSKIFCVHGGLSKDVTSLEQIRTLSRPSQIPDEGMMCDFLWADPQSMLRGWHNNDRGVSYLFGDDVVEGFLKKHDLDIIVRAHQVVADGFEFLSGKRKLVTLFSAPNYCGEFDNSGAMMVVDEGLVISFKVLKPVSKK